MPAFDTPDPVLVSLDLGGGAVRVVAGDRADTVVDVRPTDPGAPDHVAAADRTHVELADGRLSVVTPKGPVRLPWRMGRASVEVEIALPSGSRLDGTATGSGLRTSGRLGEVRFTTGHGDVRLDEAGPLRVRTAAGDVAIARAAGPVEVATGTGTVDLGAVEGTLAVTNSDGDIRIADAGGDVAATTANGRVVIDRARAGVTAKSGNGDIALGAAERGAVVLETGRGSIDVGIPDGVPAWLELTTGHGTVRNDLDDAVRPAPGEETVEVRARTGKGDVCVRRAVVAAAA